MTRRTNLTRAHLTLGELIASAIHQAVHGGPGPMPECRCATREHPSFDKDCAQHRVLAQADGDGRDHEETT